MFILIFFFEEDNPDIDYCFFYAGPLPFFAIKYLYTVQNTPKFCFFTWNSIENYRFLKIN